MTARRILYVVDDEAIVRESIVSLIAAHDGPECREFVSGSDFLAAIETLEPGCVVLDLQLDGANGATVMRALAERLDRFRTIVVTGIGDLDEAIDAFRFGVVDFLYKPYEIRPLLDAIDRAFHLLAHGREPEQLVVDARARFARLGPLEIEILTGLINGKSNQEIAAAMALDERTVQIHRARAFAALAAPSILAAVRLARIAGWPSPALDRA